ncbi:MAG: glyoxalase [Gammaproteobacteria bacterium RIFCSPLOWO2_02_FULL_56_15]|nr:MAG: glyoxalase [Gammaproteobacteria bacterium RIFCSPLOWO2_02_FULL_56_15]
MISYFMVGTNNFDEAVKFYDALMSEMGAQKAYTTDKNVGWGWGIGTPMFIVTKPYNQEPATYGNGTMISFDAESPEQVNKLHAKVLEMGGLNEGDPGMRGARMYVAYCRDLDGNKFNFIHYLPPAA